MTGKIIKGIAGFYYVYSEGTGLIECKAKGILRNRGEKPLVGDDVELELIDREKLLGNITGLIERKSELIRPAVANVDRALIVFAAAKPEPNLNLLDRLLINMAQQGLEAIICFNKCDLINAGEREKLLDYYRDCGSEVIFISAKKEIGTAELFEMLKGKTTVLAGPSGVGKSTLMNLFQPEAAMETGSISEKIERGRHTTRHSELFYIDNGTYLMDTPGFSSLYVTDIEPVDLRLYYKEFTAFEPECRFGDCVHLNEADCGVRKAVSEGRISQGRYDNYKLIYKEIKEQKKY